MSRYGRIKVGPVCGVLAGWRGIALVSSAGSGSRAAARRSYGACFQESLGAETGRANARLRSVPVLLPPRGRTADSGRETSPATRGCLRFAEREAQEAPLLVLGRGRIICSCFQGAAQSIRASPAPPRSESLASLGSSTLGRTKEPSECTSPRGPAASVWTACSCPCSRRPGGGRARRRGPARRCHEPSAAAHTLDLDSSATSLRARTL